MRNNLQMDKDWRGRAKARMKELGLKQEDLMDALGVTSQTAVSYYLSGKRSATIEQLTALAEKLEWDFQELFYGLPGTRHIPIITLREAANFGADSNYPIPNDDDREFTSIGKKQLGFLSENAFASEIVDESMKPECNPRDFVIVDPAVAPTPGNLVIAKLSNDGEAILRKYQDRGKDAKGNELFSLLALNADYKSADELIKGKNAEIIGTVISIQRYFVGFINSQYQIDTGD